MPLRIIVTEAPPEAVLTLQGELDTDAVVDLRATVHQALQRGRTTVLVDLAGVTFLDSAGLWALVFCRNLLEAASGILTVADVLGSEHAHG